ncbi:Uncharacterised protein [Serratia grimesii]|jgi:hypothetical protein|nr:Uncharacterised protein [Serratia grimesii]SMZ54916.1 Uncharacterised protein [Serratia grimesii]
MQNHALYACTRSLRQASQKKGCFRAWGKVKTPQQNQQCDGASSINEVFDFGYNGGSDLMSFSPAAVNHRWSPFPLEWADIKSYRRSPPF